MSRYVVIFIMLILFLSCSRKKSSINDSVVILPLLESLQETPSNDTFSNIGEYRVIPLETSDSVLLRRCDIYGISDDYIVIGDNNTIYFFKTDGKFHHKFNRRGNGPGEYITINDILVDDIGKYLYIHDYSKKIINQYLYDGKFLKQIPNDSIASIGVTKDGDFAVSFSPSERWSHLAGVYNSDWNPINQFIKNDTSYNNPNLFIINTIDEFNSEACIYTNDTLFNITRNHVSPALIVDKERLSLPKEIATDIKKSNEREQYIWGDYVRVAGDYCFLYFNYKSKGFYDLWNISSATLVSRNTHVTFEEPVGIPFQIGSQTVHIWPVFTQNNKIYCSLEYNDAIKLYPQYDEYDNPIILEVILNPAR